MRQQARVERVRGVIVGGRRRGAGALGVLGSRGSVGCGGSERRDRRGRRAVASSGIVTVINRK